MRELLKIVLFSMVFFVILISCKSRQDDARIIEKFYEGFNLGNYTLLSEIISDTVEMTEMEYVLAANKQEVYRFFQWDSVFEPTYKILDIVQNHSGCMVKVSKTCKRIEFLHDSVIIYMVNFEIDNNAVSRVSIVDYIQMNFEKWMSQRDALIEWIRLNHSELAGFENNITSKGARDFLSAIDLYRRNRNPSQ